MSTKRYKDYLYKTLNDSFRFMVFRHENGKGWDVIIFSKGIREGIRPSKSNGNIFKTKKELKISLVKKYGKIVSLCGIETNIHQNWHTNCTLLGYINQKGE